MQDSEVVTGMAGGLRELTLMLEFQRAEGSLTAMGALLLPDIRGVMNGHAHCHGVVFNCVNPPFTRLIQIPTLHDQWTAPSHFAGGALHASALETRAISGINQAPGSHFAFGIHIWNAQEIDRVLVTEVPALPPAAAILAATSIGLSARRWRR